MTTIIVAPHAPSQGAVADLDLVLRVLDLILLDSIERDVFV